MMFDDYHTHEKHPSSATVTAALASRNEWAT